MEKDEVVAKKLLKKFKERFKQNVPLKEHTTLKIGGPAKFFVEPKTVNELIFVCKLAKKFNKKIFVLGNGSNILAKDEGFSGIIVSTKLFCHLKCFKNQVFAGAGLKLGKLVLFLKDKGLCGMEWAIGIPGTVGGAICMNAGAFGFEISKFLNKVLIFDGKHLIWEKAKNLDFGYRNSIFQQNSNLIILGAKLKFTKKPQQEIEKAIYFYVNERKTKQNVGFPSAGSVFKKANNCSASQLVDMAGLKGKKIGGAMISTVHAGFIVNFCNASFKDVQNLVDFILISVYNKFNEKLELEIKILSD